MKAYIDNNIVSAIVKGEFPNEVLAFNRLLEYFVPGQVELVTSAVTAKEIERYRGELKADILIMVNRLFGEPFSIHLGNLL
jgi:hypothetical protein